MCAYNTQWHCILIRMWRGWACILRVIPTSYVYLLCYCCCYFFFFLFFFWWANIDLSNCALLHTMLMPIFFFVCIAHSLCIRVRSPHKYAWDFQLKFGYVGFEHIQTSSLYPCANHKTNLKIKLGRIKTYGHFWVHTSLQYEHMILFIYRDMSYTTRMYTWIFVCKKKQWMDNNCCARLCALNRLSTVFLCCWVNT